MTQFHFINPVLLTSKFPSIFNLHRQQTTRSFCFPLIRPSVRPSVR